MSSPSILTSQRVLLLALALGALSAKGAKAAALVACLAGGFELLARLLFPGNATRRLGDADRRLLARVALAAIGGGGGAYDLHDHLRVENTRDSWPLTLALKLTPALHNFFGSMHGGWVQLAGMNMAASSFTESATKPRHPNRKRFHWRPILFQRLP